MTGKLLENPQQTVFGKRFAWFEFLVVDDHPLIVIGSAVTTCENLGPMFAVAGEPIGDHGSESFKDLPLWFDVLPQIFVGIS